VARRSWARRATERATPRQVRLLTIAVVLQLIAGLLGAGLMGESASVRPATDTLARAAPNDRLLTPPIDVEAVRTAAVRDLLRRRAAALLDRDREAFLATVDPSATAFAARQAALFDALAEVPLATWYYEIDGTRTQRPSAELDARYGADAWWAPEIGLRYTLAGFDEAPTYARHVLTFVERGGRWLLAADDDFAGRGQRTTRAMWDSGPVAVVRGERSLVLGRPDARRLLTSLAAAVDAAIPRVSRVWGSDWAEQVVLLVPGSQEELGELLGGRSDLSQIAAVATAEMLDRGGSVTPVGDRVILNPPNFADLGAVGRQVVLTHEVAHVATRRASGPDMPAWLAEGLADYIGYREAEVALSVAAREVRADVRAGRSPPALPADSDFAGGNPALAQAYEQSWLAVSLLVETYGEQAVLRFYRAVGADRDVPGPQAVERAFARELGTTTAEFTASWQQYLQRRLG
jgi:hypothetical protein